jgi:hypothetical protein
VRPGIVQGLGGEHRNGGCSDLVKISLGESLSPREPADPTQEVKDGGPALEVKPGDESNAVIELMFGDNTGYGR